MPRRAVFDHLLFFTVAILAIGGVFIVGSASGYMAMNDRGDPTAYLLRQGMFLLIGMLLLVGATNFRYQRLASKPLLLVLFAGCVLALLTALAMPPINHAHRWIPLGVFRLQPSEFVKIFAVIFMSFMLSRHESVLNDTRRFMIPCGVVLGLLCYLIVIEPDLGSVVLIGAVAATMTFVAGLQWKKLGAVLALGALLFVTLIAIKPYRRDRIHNYFDGLLDPSLQSIEASSQLGQSLIAIGSGGISGVGFGRGQQKAFFVPDTHTDFIFSVIGEELGMLGAMALLAAYLLIFWRGLRAAARAPDRFGFYLALGITVLLVMQGLINICVCLGLLPTKGLTLPFISYGGSSLLATMTAAGLLLNISQQSN